MTQEFKKHWLLGEQMEGFLPCPFSGELPFIRIKEYNSFGDVAYTCYLVSEPFGIEVRASSMYSMEWGYTKEQCMEKALADVKKIWNTRK